MELATEQQKNRGIILAGIAVTGLILSSNYLWSIFSGPLSQANGWSIGQVSMIYSVNLLVSCISNFFVEAIHKRFPYRSIFLISSIGYSAGWILSSFAGELWQMYLFYDLLMGGCGGILYNTIISTAGRWYPDRKGFANGICIASLGIAPLVLAPVANWVVERYDVFTAFRSFGAVYGLLLVSLSMVICMPAEDWKPQGWVEQVETVNLHGRDRSAGEMLRTPAFWLIWLTIACATSTGTMMSSHMSNIGQKMLGMTTTQGALLLSVFALANTISRLTLAPLSDRVGRFPVLSVIIGLTAVDMLFVIERTHSFLPFNLALVVVAMGFGGIMAILPALVSDMFGETHFSNNYSFVYSGYTVGTFIGPNLGAAFLERTGSYVGAITVLGVLALLGLIFILLASRASRRL